MGVIQGEENNLPLFEELIHIKESSMYFDPYQWLDQCIQMIQQEFGYERVSYDQSSFKWLMIKGFPLPKWWRQLSTNLLIILPNTGNIHTYPPDKFYLNKGLRTVNGLVPKHYYEGGGYNDMSSKGWARYSFELDSWKPSSDVVSGNTLIDLLAAIYVSLDLLARETEGVT